VCVGNRSTSEMCTKQYQNITTPQRREKKRRREAIKYLIIALAFSTNVMKYLAVMYLLYIYSRSLSMVFTCYLLSWSLFVTWYETNVINKCSGIVLVTICRFLLFHKSAHLHEYTPLLIQ